MDHVPTEKSDWYKKTTQEAIDLLNTSRSGLGIVDVQKRLTQFGENALPESKPDTFLILFLRQFKSPLIYILVVSALVVFLIDHAIDSLVIIIALLVNAVVGGFQEGKAQNALAALRNFTETKSTVFRDDKEVIIDAKNIVPGDILFSRREIKFRVMEE